MIDWTKDEISFYEFDGNSHVLNYLSQKIAGTTMAFRQPDYIVEQYMMDVSAALDLEIKYIPCANSIIFLYVFT